jgi:heat shock protein HtpX
LNPLLDRERIMAMAKRIFLFLATNLAIMVVVSIVLAVLQATGIFRLGGAQGGLLLFCFIYGMGASLVSLLLSRQIAKWSMGVRLVDGQTGDPDLDWLHNTVGNLSRAANLPMPEVGFYESPEVNAFATGPSKSRALVAVSTGLLRGMKRNEIEAVLGHEMTHVSNGDMVTMVLIQGVVNAFALYLSYVVAAIVRGAMRSRNERDSFLGVIAGQLVFVAGQIVFTLLGSLITAWFSRRREFRADQGGAELSGRGNMVSALRALLTNRQAVDARAPALQTLKISNTSRRGLLFSTHPPLELRIAALEGRA